MTLQQMRYVITTAECYSITSAAEKFQLSQPNLSNAIKDLEQELGTGFVLKHLIHKIIIQQTKTAQALQIFCVLALKI